MVDRGEAALIRDVATDERFRGKGSITSLFRSALCVPLLGSEGKPIGMVQLGVQEDRRNRYGSEDLELLAALALPMGAAVENDRLLRERAHWAAAREIQRALLPRERPEVPGYSFWECYRPALEVGGDSYDYIQTARDGQDGDFRWVISVGDVSGKGMPAALLLAAVRPEVRHAVRGGGSPEEVLTDVNRHLCNGGFDARFVTMILAEWSRHDIGSVWRAPGTGAPLLRRANGTVVQVELPGRGLPLGISANEAYAPTSLELEPGDVLVLYSDGLKDALDRHRSPFGMARVLQTLGTPRPSIHSRARPCSRRSCGTRRESHHLTI